MSKPAECCTYVNDDGEDCYALVVADNVDKVNVAYLDPANYSWHAANDVPKNSDRLK